MGPQVASGYRSDSLISVYDENAWEIYDGTVTLENDKCFG